MDVGCGFPPVTAVDTARSLHDWQVYGVDRSFADYVLYDADGYYACFDKNGETLGLVGESGCGKSSVARAVMQLPPPDSGNVFFEGEDLAAAGKKRLGQLRPEFQIIFQGSISSLNPRRKIGDAIVMPLRIGKKCGRRERRRLAEEMMAQVGMDPEHCERLPFELSGGQCQRVQIARALMSKPRLPICDEPVSSLDVSVQTQIVNLLERLRRKFGLTMLFISHDLAVVKNVCDRVAVMYLGKLCEIATAEQLYRSPAHPLHKGPAERHPPARPRSAPPAIRSAFQRNAIAHQSALRMPVSNPMPLSETDMRGKRAETEENPRRRPCGMLVAGRRSGVIF